ncbi:hypothetical protein [Actinomyces viscosus]|uniref:hypothetical protein n=1 Tax=Actinomyces viscosus TaxID=1656 RepID=UPI0028E2FFBD|nr:hypothetical protein [Actinomyces viscosus]
MTTYDVKVSREGANWLAQCVQEPTAHTWAPTLTAVRSEIVDAIVLAADLPDGAVIDVRLLPNDGLPEYIVRALKVGNDRVALRSAEVALRDATEESVRAMLAQGHSVRDVAGAVALTPGRVAQLSA